MIGKVLIAVTLVLLTERSDAASLSAVDILTENEDQSLHNNQEVIELIKPILIIVTDIGVLFKKNCQRCNTTKYDLVKNGRVQVSKLYHAFSLVQIQNSYNTQNIRTDTLYYQMTDGNSDIAADLELHQRQKRAKCPKILEKRGCRLF